MEYSSEQFNEGRFSAILESMDLDKTRVWSYADIEGSKIVVDYSMEIRTEFEIDKIDHNGFKFHNPGFPKAYRQEFDREPGDDTIDFCYIEKNGNFYTSRKLLRELNKFNTSKQSS